MSRYFSLLVLAALLAGGLTSVFSDEPAKDKKAAPPVENEDILKTAQEWNSSKFAAPPTEFRAGHVTARKLDDKAIQKVDKGFVVSLPSNAPIPTPTVYDGKLYVSGGFHSKEFYCFKADTGELVWGVDLDDDGPSAAVCADGVIVFNTESCTIFALDSKTGKHLWSYYLGDPLTSTPTIANGLVFTSYPAAGGGGNAQQQMQNGNQLPNIPQLPNGNQLKQAPPAPPEPKAPPAKADKKEAAPAKAAEKPLTAPPCSHVLAAFDLKTGKIRWQRWIDSDVMTAPVAVGKDLFATSFAGVVYKFNQEDGTILSAVKSRATSAPVVVGDSVYLTRRTDDGKGPAREAIAARTGDSQREIYKGKDREAAYIDDKVQEKADLAKQAKALDAGNGFGAGAPGAANPQAAKGNVGQANVSSMQAFQGSRILSLGDRNFNCMGDEVVCTDPKTGKNLWSSKIAGDLKKEGGFLAAPPAAAGGMVFLVTLQGEVLQMDPKDGKVAKTYKVGHPVRFQPAIEGGKIYVGTQNGKVVCLDAGDAKFTGWSCWGANAGHTGVAK